MRIAREAVPFALPVAALATGLAAVDRWTAAGAAAALAGLLALFFRVPRRLPPADPDAVVAPASGRVMGVEAIEGSELGPGRWQRIATFLSVLDVHVQRAPVDGEVVEVRFQPGRKLAAFRPEAAEANESRLLVLRARDGELVGVRQIAGLLARRTVSYLDRGSRVERGGLIGLIKFGSRVDLLLPEQYVVTAVAGQRLREGETVVARRAPR
jgi:phosphatidylserine decarboxylase